MKKKVNVIGAGFAGLSVSACLASQGYDVTVLEKHNTPGGRARKFTAKGFTFDMGPSWYWMPDVFERFYNRFGKTTSDFYDLKRLDPSYRIFYPSEVVDIPASMDELRKLFEEKEAGSAKYLDQFIEEARFKYELGIQKLVYMPGQRITELLDQQVFKGLFKLHVFSSVASYIRKYFKNKQLIQLLEFPILFLGATADETPALYTLMNYADLKLGTWYPMGGMSKIAEAMYKIATDAGVKFEFNANVTSFDTQNGNTIKKIKTEKGVYKNDLTVASADYHFVERFLLNVKQRQYDDLYWSKRTMAPSSLIFYLGIKGCVKNLRHHNLFFDEDFVRHSYEIYKNPQWPSKPLFYVCCPSKTDGSVAPQDCENLFILIPIAAGLHDEEEIREKYYQLIMERLELHIGDTVKNRVLYKRSFAINDFINEYNSFKGNAYGLANTLKQTANLKPSIKSSKVKNLYYTGQLTVPGPGVPPSIISGQVVADFITKNNHQ